MATIEEAVPGKLSQGQQSFGAFVRRNGLQIGIIAVFLIMLLFLIIVAPGAFRSKEIYVALMQQVPYYGVIAIPLTLLVIAREIDLSFGSIMAVAVAGFLMAFNATHSTLVAVIACLGIGLLAGLINGLLVVRIGLPSLITTLGTQFFFAGFALVITNGAGGSLLDATAQSPFLHDLFVGRLFDNEPNLVPIPSQMIWMVVIAVATWLLLNRHRFGAHVYLIGDNDSSAKLMGVNIDQRRLILFVLVGVAAAFGGLLSSWDISYYWSTKGGAYLLPTLAAVFLGGTPVLGGVGTILGTFVGCFIIQLIEPGTVAIGLTSFYTQLIYGLIIVVAVAMHTLLRRRIR
jgi:simple sugar transport system permease protein